MNICLNRKNCLLTSGIFSLVVCLGGINLACAQAEAELEAASITPTPLPPGRQSRPTDLDHELHRLLPFELKDEAIVTLDAQGETFICIWKHTIKGKALGAVILLHEEGQNADWPLTMNSLRMDLADVGWSTLSVSLPNPHSTKLRRRPTPSPAPSRPPSDSMDTEADTEKTETKTGDSTQGDNQAPMPSPAETALPDDSPPVSPSVEARVNARLDAVIQHLHSIGQFNLVIVGSGLGAARASVFYNRLTRNDAAAAKKEGTNTDTVSIQRPIRALILINARNQIANSELSLLKQFKDPGLPILDIIFNEHYLDSQEAKQRREVASRQQLEYYTQIKMRRPRSAANRHRNPLVKRVRGFLNRHAKGVDISQ